MREHYEWTTSSITSSHNKSLKDKMYLSSQMEIVKSSVKCFMHHILKRRKGYQTFFIGVYNEKKDEIKFARLIHAREVEQKVKEVLGSEHLVVLG